MGKSPVFSSLLGRYCSKLWGEQEVALILIRRTRTMERCCGVLRCLVRSVQKKCAPVNRKSPGRILDMGRWLVGARSCEEKCGTPMRNGAKPAFLQSYVSTGCSVFRDVAAGIARRHGRSRIRFLGWRNRGLRCLSPCIPLPRRVVGGRPPFGRFRPC